MIIDYTTTDVDFDTVCLRCGRNLLECKCHQTADTATIFNQVNST